MATVWIDLDNAPHVPFFAPLISGLRERGHNTVITVRDYGYTRHLAERHELEFDVIGTHPGRNPIKKVVSLTRRVGQLSAWARRRGIDVAVSHGSRGLVLASRLCGIPCVTLYDYEFVSTSIFNRLSQRVLLPELLPDELIASMGIGDRAKKYPGLKEEVYLGGFAPSRDVLSEFSINGDATVVVIRPPARGAHYHNPESEAIIDRFLDRVKSDPSAVAVVAPRTPREADEFEIATRDAANVHVLRKPVDGLQLIWCADVVVGGGGTMNREAAMLGVPVYSVFMGKVGAIDRALSEEGRLTFVRSVGDADSVPLQKRDRRDETGAAAQRSRRSSELIDFINDEIEAIAGQ